MSWLDAVSHLVISVLYQRHLSVTELSTGLTVGVEESSSGPVGPTAIGYLPEGQGLFVLLKSLPLFNYVSTL